MNAKGTRRSYVRQEINSSVRYPCGNRAGVQKNPKSNAKGIWTPYGKDGTNLAIKHPQDSRNQVQTNPPYQSLEIWNFRACHDVNRTHNFESIWIPHDTKAAATSSTQFPISREFARCHAAACCLLSVRLRASVQNVPISLSSTLPFLFTIHKLVELSCQWIFATVFSHSWTLSSFQ